LRGDRYDDCKRLAEYDIFEYGAVGHLWRPDDRLW
jgi:hypothetical protein